MPDTLQKKSEFPQQEYNETLPQQEVSLYGRPEQAGERQYASEEERIEALRHNLQEVPLDEGTPIDKRLRQRANEIKNLKIEKKLEELLKDAKEKGVIHAVHTAQKLHDPYLLDRLHDTLVKDGYYKKFLK